MSDMPCVSGVDLLMDYLEGVLPAATVAALDRHVAGCRRCQAFVASYRATPGVFREATDVTLPAALQSSLMAWLGTRRGERG
jgi:anti-sigma factor RsiW